MKTLSKFSFLGISAAIISLLTYLLVFLLKLAAIYILFFAGLCFLALFIGYFVCQKHWSILKVGSLCAAVCCAIGCSSLFFSDAYTKMVLSSIGALAWIIFSLSLIVGKNVVLRIRILSAVLIIYIFVNIMLINAMYEVTDIMAIVLVGLIYIATELGKFFFITVLLLVIYFQQCNVLRLEAKAANKNIIEEGIK